MRPVPEKNRLSKQIRAERARRFFALLLSLLLLLPGLTGCRKGTEDGGAGNGESVSQGTGEAAVLTHVFRPTFFQIPEDYSFSSSVIPRYDAETGALTFIAQWVNSWEDENGVWQNESKMKIVSSTPDEILSEEELSFGAGGNEFLSNGVFSEDGLFLVSTAFDPETGDETSKLLFKAYGAESDPIESGDLRSLFESVGVRSWFHLDRIAADGDGNVYLSSEQEIVVLTPGLEKLFSVTAPQWINSMAADGEGTVWVTGYFGNGQGMCAIDRETRSLGDPRDLPQGVNELFFGPGHDFYYRDDSGLWAGDYDESGKASGELIFDFLNSDVSRDSVSVLAVYGPEAALLDSRNGVPALYRKSEDIDLSSVTVLRFVYTHQLDYQAGKNIVEFNRTHDGVRIVAENYEGEGDFYGGENRLLTEMLTDTGGGRPDIVFLSKSGGGLAGIVRHGLFTDLNPYTEKPGIVNKDNIMGCILRTFTDGEGRLFALTDNFTLRTYVTTDELLGKYAGRDSWTAEELLDFAENLPEGRFLMETLTRETAANSLLGPEGYASFISEDGKSCSFDSDLFVRFLQYISALPTFEEYSARSPYYNLTQSEKYQYYHDGVFALKLKPVHDLADFMSMELDYGTKDWRLIGYPTNSGYGTVVGTESVYVITAATEERADLAWEALECLLTPSEYHMGWNIPGLVSEFENEVEEYYTYEFMFTYSGRGSWGTKGDNPRELTEPGIVTEFTEADERRIRDILDNRCGVPFAFSADEDVTAIVEEEISVFLGGVGTAEDCAKKIQSRVSILLAEKG